MSNAVLAAALAELSHLPKSDEYSMRYMGDEVLHAPTRKVERDDFPYVAGVLIPAMHRIHAAAWTAGVGLSANQVGSNLRVSIALLGTKAGAKDWRGQYKGEWYDMVNLQIVERSPQTVTCSGEGCLSVPHFRTSVERHTWVVAAWHDPKDGSAKQKKFTDFDAEILQHECDHLDGRCIVDGLPRQQRRAAERSVAKWVERKRG